MNYKRMLKLHNYVYDTEPNSPERLKRLAELSNEESEQLFHFDCKVMSGEIDLSGIEREDENSMRYKEWRMRKSRLSAADYGPLAVFERMHPDTAKKYTNRYLADQKKRSEIMGIKDVSERQAAIAANIDLF